MTTALVLLLVKNDQPLAPVVANSNNPRASQPVNVISAADPQIVYNGDGYMWPVKFELDDPAGEPGWLVQEIYVHHEIKYIDREGNRMIKNEEKRFYEAWPIRQGDIVSMEGRGGGLGNPKYNDIYLGGMTCSMPACEVKTSVAGEVKFFQGPLPEDFVRENPDTYAGWLHSSTKMPSFWDHSVSGTPHHFEYYSRDRYVWMRARWGDQEQCYGQGCPR